MLNELEKVYAFIRKVGYRRVGEIVAYNSDNYFQYYNTVWAGFVRCDGPNEQYVNLRMLKEVFDSLELVKVLGSLSKTKEVLKDVIENNTVYGNMFEKPALEKAIEHYIAIYGEVHVCALFEVKYGSD